MGADWIERDGRAGGVGQEKPRTTADTMGTKLAV